MKNIPFKNHNPEEKVNFDILAQSWGSPYVAREKVEEFTGGIVNPRYLANLDCKGQGPPRVRVGRKVAYPVNTFIKWLEGRASIPKSR